MNNYTSYTDQELLACLQGSAANATGAFSEFYERYAQRILRYCVAVLGKNDGNDVFQETFIRFYKTVQTTRIDNIPAFLLTIARNGCIDHKRRQKETITLEEFHHSLPQVQESDQQELLRLIELALEYLEFDLKEVFVLRQYQELSYEEIALLTGVPVTTVTKRIWRAKERLKKILSPFIRDLAQF